MANTPHRDAHCAEQLAAAIQDGLNAFGRPHNLSPLAWNLVSGKAVWLVGSANTTMYSPDDCRTAIRAWAAALGLTQSATKTGTIEYGGRVGSFDVTVWTIDDPAEFFAAWLTPDPSTTPTDPH
jgi:hypothetical protein